MVWSPSPQDDLYGDDDDTIKTPTSPDSVCFPTSLTPMIGQPGAAARAGAASCDQSAALSSTNGSDSTWRASSLLGSDGIPWWEDQETSKIAGYGHGSGTVYSGTTSINNHFQKLSVMPRVAAPTAESIHADLVVYMESMRGDTVHQYHPATLTWSFRSSDNPSVSECVSSVTAGDEAIFNHAKRQVATADRRRRSFSGDVALAKGRSSSRVQDAAKVSEYEDDNSCAQVESIRGRPVRQESQKRRRRSLSNNRLVPSENSHGSGGSSNERKHCERKSSSGSSERREPNTTRRRRSIAGTRAVAEGDKGRSSQHEPSAVRRRPSLSGGRLVPSSAHGRSRSSRAIADADTEYSECESSFCGDKERKPKSQGRRSSSRRPSLSMESRRRRRSLSTGLIAPSQSRSRSSRAMYGNDDTDDEPSVYGDQNDDANQRQRRSCRQEGGRESTTRRHRSRSTHRLHESDKPREADEMHSSSRHQHRRSKSGRDLLASSSHGHHSSDDGGGRSSRERERDRTRSRSPSRHGGGEQRRRRSRSRHTVRPTSPEENDDARDPESKTAVKNFIKGLLKDAPTTNNRQQLDDESSMMRPSRHRQQPTSSSSSHHKQPERRQSCGGLDARSSRHTSTTARRPSGRHI